MGKVNTALVISSVFEPMVVLVMLSAFAGRKYGLSGGAFTAYLAYLVLFAAIVGIARFTLAKRNKTNWDLSDRRKRVVPVMILTAIVAANTATMSLFGNGSLTAYHGIWLLWAIGFAAITLFMKISGHVSVVTIACGMLIRWYGWGALPVFAVLPVLAWSRVSLGRHTIAEVVWGMLYAIFILLVW